MPWFHERRGRSEEGWGGGWEERERETDRELDDMYRQQGFESVGLAKERYEITPIEEVTEPFFK